MCFKNASEKGLKCVSEILGVSIPAMEKVNCEYNLKIKQRNLNISKALKRKKKIIASFHKFHT